jgi:hypothetical protein
MKAVPAGFLHQADASEANFRKEVPARRWKA